MCTYLSLYIYISIYLSIYLSIYIIYTYIHVYDSQIVHHIPCFNLFILLKNSFDNQESEINKNDIFLRFDILQKLSTYHTFNKFTSSYHSSCFRLCLQLT